MSHKVFANAREVSSRSGKGKAACAFPDVCFTPPPPPGVPIPYPNTGVDSDTSNGSRSVRIARREAMLKNKSYFKKSTGDEAGCAPKKGVITSRIKGKVYFNAWSMDVKIEGENVVRHMDLTTHNHGSYPANTTTWPYLSTRSPKKDEVCGEEEDRRKTACQGVDDPCACVGKDKPSGSKASSEASDLGDQAAANKCLAARRCMLQRYEPSGCCPPQTPHHLIEASAVHDKGRGGTKKNKTTGETFTSTPLAGISGYDEGRAPCVCAEGKNQWTGTHGIMHTLQSAHATGCPEDTLPLEGGGATEKPVKVTTYAAARDNAIEAFQTTFPHSNCGKECLQAQLDNYHNQCGMNDNTRIKAVEEGTPDVPAAHAAIRDRNDRVRRLLSSQEGGGAGAL